MLENNIPSNSAQDLEVTNWVVDNNKIIIID